MATPVMASAISVSTTTAEASSGASPQTGPGSRTVRQLPVLPRELYNLPATAPGYRAYAGHYSGTTVRPSSTGVSSTGIEAQCLLDPAGFSPGTIDGVFGTKSQAAATDFQRLANKYYGVTLTVDGKGGPKTWPVPRAHAF
ncbi:peptidoglycan-binding domain-containing protein [Streptomyces mirabilis]|uniref:peptidoglycan-binding domain-containing protein n=1 Tax=Streptomyces mirabilis TaxID=68239 RepID=UPI0036F04C72